MFLADWSGRRIAAYALTWLVGFPVLVTAALLIGERASMPLGYPRMDSAQAVALERVADSLRRYPPSDTLRAIALLPRQRGDIMSGGMEVVGVREVDDGSDLPLLPWLLPPVLLVAAWAWSRRSRPEPD